MSDKPELKACDEIASCERWRHLRTLWSSNRGAPDDYYADKLELLRDGTKFALRLDIAGTVHTVPCPYADENYGGHHRTLPGMPSRAELEYAISKLEDEICMKKCCKDGPVRRVAAWLRQLGEGR